MESEPQSPEFKINPEKSSMQILPKIHFKSLYLHFQIKPVTVLQIIDYHQYWYWSN